MKPCFADTFFFIALLQSDSESHQKAIAANRVNRVIVTSWFVLLELADHLCDRNNRHLFGEVVDAIAEDARFEVIPVDPDLLERAVALYRDRPDKDWSLTDCTSFVIMTDSGIDDALTGDRHFEQAGFHALLKPD